MVFLQVLFQFQFALYAWVALADHANKMLAEQALLVKTRFQLWHIAQRQINSAAFQQLRRIAGQWEYINADTWRSQTQTFPQLGQEYQLADVGHRNFEHALGSARFKMGTEINHRTDGIQSRSHRLYQFCAQWRWHHTVGGAHKQGVAKMLAQFGQRNTDGGLG